MCTKDHPNLSKQNGKTDTKLLNVQLVYDLQNVFEGLQNSVELAACTHLLNRPDKLHNQKKKRKKRFSCP